MCCENCKRDWVLTHHYESYERGLPITIIYLFDKKELKEEGYVVTGHLKRNQIIELFDCTYIKPGDF